MQQVMSMENSNFALLNEHWMEFFLQMLVWRSFKHYCDVIRFFPGIGALELEKTIVDWVRFHFLWLLIQEGQPRFHFGGFLTSRPATTDTFDIFCAFPFW